jgi:LemA protein
MKKYTTLIVGLCIVAIVLLWYVNVHNGLVTADENIKGKWSQVQNVYQRRMELIPNLVATVKGYASQEEKVLREVTELRARIGAVSVSSDILNDPQALSRFQKEQSELGGALSRLLMVSENYPDLKSNQNFLALQSQLEGTENRIAVERKRFIDAVQEYNTKIRRIPTSVVAVMGGFREKANFTADQGAEKAPVVKF